MGKWVKANKKGKRVQNINFKLYRQVIEYVILCREEKNTKQWVLNDNKLWIFY